MAAVILSGAFLVACAGALIAVGLFRVAKSVDADRQEREQRKQDRQAFFDEVYPETPQPRRDDLAERRRRPKHLIGAILGITGLGWLFGAMRAHAKPLAATAGMVLVAAVSSPLVLAPSPHGSHPAAPPPSAPAVPSLVTTSPPAPPVPAPSSSTPAVMPASSGQATAGQQPSDAGSVNTPVSTPPATPPASPRLPQVAPAPTHNAAPPPVSTDPSPAPLPAAPSPVQPPPGCHYIATVNAAPLAQARLLCI